MNHIGFRTSRLSSLATGVCLEIYLLLSNVSSETASSAQAFLSRSFSKRACTMRPRSFVSWKGLNLVLPSDSLDWSIHCLQCQEPLASWTHYSDHERSFPIVIIAGQIFLEELSSTDTHPHDPDEEERVQPKHEENGHDVDVFHVVGHHEGAVVYEQLLKLTNWLLLWSFKSTERDTTLHLRQLRPGGC